MLCTKALCKVVSDKKTFYLVTIHVIVKDVALGWDHFWLQNHDLKKKSW